MKSAILAAFLFGVVALCAPAAQGQDKPDQGSNRVARVRLIPTEGPPIEKSIPIQSSPASPPASLDAPVQNIKAFEILEPENVTCAAYREKGSIIGKQNLLTGKLPEYEFTTGQVFEPGHPEKVVSLLCVA